MNAPTMRALLRPVLLALTVLALLLGIGGAPVRGAAPDPTPTPTPGGTPTDPATPRTDLPDPDVDRSQNITFGIGPAHAVPDEQVVDGRPYLQYLSAPGGVVRDTVAIINYGPKPIRLNVYVTDALQGTDGAFGLKAGDETPADAGAWFRIKAPGSKKLVERAVIRIPARKGNTYGRVLVPVEARIPADATPGDHVAGVIASLETVGKDTEGTPIKFDQRIGLRTYFRLSGEVRPALAIENLRATYGWKPDVNGNDSVTVTYDVRNTGNVRMNAAQIVNLQRPFRDDLITRPEPITDLLPGSVLSVTHTVDARFSAGQLEPLVSLIATPVDETVPADRTPIQASVKVWAWQWIAVVVGIALLLLLALGYWRWRRRRRKAQAAAGSTDGPGKRRGARTKAKDVVPAAEPQPVARGLARVGAGVAVLLALVVTGFAPTAVADVSKPGGGKLFLEADHATGDPKRAITDGVWGHEGKDGDLGTYISADLTDSRGKTTEASQAFWMKRFAITDFNNVAVAFVKASKDGSTERPQVSEGQTAGDVFEWFTEFGMGGGLTGTDNTYTDQVAVVSTKAEFDAWVRAGQPEQVYDDKLVARDALVDGLPKSAAPRGKSIKNRWAAGSRISLVVFQYDGFDANNVPIVSRAEDGRARSAWLTFTTVAGADDPSVLTSAGYHVLTASPLPKKPSEVSDDPSAEVNPKGAAGAATPGAGETPTGAADQGAAPTGEGDPQAAVDKPASWDTLWTGSGWTWLVVGLLAVVGVVLGGTVMLRGRAGQP